VVKLAPWQIGGQRHATGLSWCGWFALDAVLAQGLELVLNRCDIGVDGLIEQAQLIGVEAFATATKLPALKHRDLMGEHEDALLFSLDGLVALSDVSLALGNISIALGDEARELGQLLALIGELGHQLMSQVAQL
jgi:hypothetical protein